MIHYKKVRYKNILSVGNNFIEIDLQRNLKTLVTASNGSGKSVMIDAVCYALYGKAYRKINKPQLINSINQKGLLVEIDFTIGDKNYTVRRGMKPNVFEIYQDEFLINQDSATKDYQGYLENEILKMSFKTFTQIVVIGSATHIPFMQLPSHMRREIIENILDLEIFSVMNTLLKERVQANRNDVVQIKYDLDLANEKITLHKEYLKSLKQNTQKLVDDNKKKIDSTNSEIEDIFAENTKYSDEIASLKITIEDHPKITKRIHSIVLLERQLEDKISRLKNDISFFDDNDVCPSCKQSIDHSFKCETVDTKSAAIQETEDAMQELAGEMDKCNTRLSEINEVSNKIEKLNSLVTLNNAKIRSLQHFIQKVQEEVDKLNDDIKVNSEDEEKYELLKKNVKVLEKRREQLSKEKSVLDTASILLKDGGIKSKIIKQYVPIINKLVNKYLSILELFVQFELDENFNEVIKSRHRDEFSYESFSEGEKMRIDLALLATWRAIGKIRSNNNVNLLILDEVMDASLDVNGIDNMFAMLDSFNENTNIFVISHRENIIDKFDGVVRFEKVKNFTQLVE